MAPRPLPSLFPAPSDLPAPPHTPQLSRTPRGGALCIPRWDPTTLAPGRGFASASQRQGCRPSEGAPHHPLPLSRTTEEGRVPRWDSFVPPHMCSFSHCDFALLPTQSGVGEELPRKHGLSQVLSPFLLLGTAAGRRGTGCYLPQPLSFLLSPVPRRPGCPLNHEPAPLSSGLGGPHPPPPHGKMSQASHSRPSSAHSQVDWNCAKPQDLSVSRTPHVGKELVCICDRLVAMKQSGSRPVGVPGRAPGERRPLWFLWCENSSFPSIAKRRKPTHPPSSVPGRGKGGWL